jgi:hypothetical protein
VENYSLERQAEKLKLDQNGTGMNSGCSSQVSSSTSRLSRTSSTITYDIHPAARVAAERAATVVNENHE